jgi:hypothetical protein
MVTAPCCQNYDQIPEGGQIGTVKADGAYDTR